MLKVTINSLQGQKLAANLDIFVKTKVNIDFDKNVLNVSLNQSTTQDTDPTKSARPSANLLSDYIGLNKRNVQQANPSLPAKTADLAIMGDNIAKDWINSLKLPQIVSVNLL